MHFEYLPSSVPYGRSVSPYPEHLSLARADLYRLCFLADEGPGSFPTSMAVLGLPLITWLKRDFAAYFEDCLICSVIVQN